MLVTLCVSAENLFIEGPIRTVVHAEHDRHHGWLVGKYIARQPQIDRSTAAARHAVAAPSGMDKTDIQFRETREDVGFSESRVQALIRDAIAVEHDPVALLEGKTFRPDL